MSGLPPRHCEIDLAPALGAGAFSIGVQTVDRCGEQAEAAVAADILAPVGDRMSLAIREVIDLLECGGSGD